MNKRGNQRIFIEYLKIIYQEASKQPESIQEMTKQKGIQELFTGAVVAICYNQPTFSILMFKR